MKSESNTTSQPYHNTGVTGERSSSPLDEPFPGNCTTCLPGYPTEYCDYKEKYCVKLSDSYSIVGTDGSFLYNTPHRLNTPCTPLYLQMLEDESYAIVCHESSYDILRFKSDGSAELDGPLSYIEMGGILVEHVSSSNNHHQANLYQVGLQDGYIATRDVKQGLDGFIATPDSCETEPLVFRPTFSRAGLLFLQCTASNSNNQAYFLCSVTSENCQMLDLCASPLPSPPGSTGSNTFTTTCGDTLTVYNTNNVSEYRSVSFDSTIASDFPLDGNTRLIKTGSSQYVVSVDTFLSGTGWSGIVTLKDTGSCSDVSKLIPPGIYAAACKNDSLYDIRLVNITSGQSLGPMQGLTEEPRDIFFEAQEPPTPVPSSSSPETTRTHPYTSEPPSPRPSTVSYDIPTSSIIGVQNIPPTNPPTSDKTRSVSARTAWIIAAVVVAVVFLLIVTLVVFIFRYRTWSRFSACALRCRKKYPTEEQNVEHSNRSITVCYPSDPTSSLASSSSSVTTVAIPETCLQSESQA